MTKSNCYGVYCYFAYYFTYSLYGNNTLLIY